MKRLIYIIMVVSFWMQSSVCFASEVNVFSIGKTVLTVDGDLSDWSTIGAQSTAIEHLSAFGHSYALIEASPADLSANFRSAVDDQYLFLTIDVTDDHLVFQREHFGECWWDDAVQIILQNGSVIDITKLKNGSVGLEGIVVLAGRRIRVPYFWEASGVKAAILEKDDGYTVEVKLPLGLLDISDVNNPSLKLNLVVFDHDSGGKRKQFLQWSKSSQAKRISADGRLKIVIEPDSPSSANPVLKAQSGSLESQIHQNEDGELILSLYDECH